MPTLKALLLLNGPRVRVFFMKILARLRLRWTALILSVKGPSKINFLENPFISKKERVERYVRLHTLGINDHLDLVPASSWTVDKVNARLIIKIEPPRCKL